MNRRYLFCLIGTFMCLIMGNKGYSQGTSINTTGTAADTSAILDISSTTKGLLIPRMTTAQRNAIATPATGLLIYNMSTNCFNYYTGDQWVGLADEPTTWYKDNDGDGYGTNNDSIISCPQPIGYVNNKTDCNDGDYYIHPGAAEKCNDLDDNCNGQIDEAFPEKGQPCVAGIGACAVTGIRICDINETSTICNATPGQPSQEVCDGIDNDCDGSVDEGVDCGSNINATAYCYNGYCVWQCNYGYADCDADISNPSGNGCEYSYVGTTSDFASNITQTSFTANWADNGIGTTGYYLDVATDIGFSNYVPGYSNFDAGNSTNYNVTGLSANTNYYYRVRAYGCVTNPSSATITVTTLP